METFKLLAIIAFPVIILHASEDAQYVGCFRDFSLMGTRDRAPPEVHSVERCLDICSVKKEKYASLQFGKACLCSDKYNKYEKSGNCNMKCKSRQMCGSLWTSSLYKIG
eukprot:XP_014776971.1 PREDICTED: WSC domain-containing protein 2-like [Octopus bimaculoides]